MCECFRCRPCSLKLAMMGVLWWGSSPDRITVPPGAVCATMSRAICCKGFARMLAMMRSNGACSCILTFVKPTDVKHSIWACTPFCLALNFAVCVATGSMSVAITKQGMALAFVSLRAIACQGSQPLCHDDPYQKQGRRLHVLRFHAGAGCGFRVCHAR